MAVSGIPTRQPGGRGEALIKSGQMLVDKADDLDGENQKSRSEIDSATRSINSERKRDTGRPLGTQPSGGAPSTH